MKDIKTNYVNKMVDEKFYGVINVRNSSMKNEEIKEMGYVFAP